MLREGRDDDADGFIALMGACWAEYPGCVMDVDAELPEVRALATYYAEAGGRLWAADAHGTVVGMIATAPTESNWEIKRLYVARAHRGTGLAHALLDAAELHAASLGAQRLALWTDTRFEAAHRFYEKRGYVRAGELRALNDLSNSVEYGYLKPCRRLAGA